MISCSRSCHSVRSLFRLDVDGKVQVQDLAMKTLRFTSIIARLCLVSIAFLPTLATVQAASATWDLNPVSGDWNTAENWTPNTVPNGPSDTATFGVSNITDVSLSDAIEVEGIIFNPGANPYTVTATNLTISGTGITNNSGATQNFVTNNDSFPLIFTHSATAGSGTVFTNNRGRIEFDDSARAGTATFITNGNGSITIFFDQATSDSATFITNSGGTTFPGKAANATLITNSGGSTYFGFDDRAENATLIANGGVIIFDSGSTGGTGRVELFGNGLLDLPNAFGISLGSIEGDGQVELGDFVLTVGSNNLSTVFGGVIKDEVSEGGAGTLKKVGSGALTLSSKNIYEGGTVVLEGTLILASEIASATGAGPVDVKGGTLSGTGTIFGAVTVGTGSGSGAILDPGNGTTPGTLTIQNHLILHDDATCAVLFNSDTPASDQVTAKGIRIRNASVLFQDDGTALLPPGTTFTIINNIGARRIKGTFTNLPDGSIITIGSNNFQASYSGGDGNDLTLTVVL